MPTTTTQTPRALLTSLISSLNSHPISLPPNATNPLQNAPPKIRSLLATLHVIYPQLLLPALDLLDRQLVTRVKLALEPLNHDGSRGMKTAQPLPAGTAMMSEEGGGGEVRMMHDDKVQDAVAEALRDEAGIGEDAGEGRIEDKAETAFYLVHSSQAPPGRSRYRDAGEKNYIVRLSAWSCSCASFAFSAYPGPASSETLSFGEYSGVDDKVDPEDEKWEYGGLSVDGKDGGPVAVCKHLLACVLADRWKALDDSVKERVVRKEECAGLGAGF